MMKHFSISRWQKVKSVAAGMVSVLVLIAGLIVTGQAVAANLKDIQVTNGATTSTVNLSFDGAPVYAFFPLHNPERVVIDIRQTGVISGLPLDFNGQNLVRRIRSSTAQDAQSIRLVLELTQGVKTRATTQKNGSLSTVVFTLSSNTVAKQVAPVAKTTTPARHTAVASSSAGNPFNNDKTTAVTSTVTSNVASSAKSTPRTSASSSSGDRIVVAIDAGHGGQDPGAIGQDGLKEKNVTIAIARKLQDKMNNDPMFKPVLTRTGDYFISVMGRSDVARKQGANVLVSIHADAAPNRSANGASVWVLSNRRANSEMGNWLEQHEKQSELLGGAGDLLANSSADKYLSQAVLDLQFGHSQRVGYDVAVKVLREMQRVGSLHKRRPEHASLGVLRSPDIPSLLVETGFISNSTEERLLGSNAYQDKIATSIYNGLRSYFLTHPLQSDPKVENRPLMASAAVDSSSLSGGLSQPGPIMNTSSTARSSASGKVAVHTGTVHTVKGAETLSGIAQQYGTTMTAIRDLNKLKKDGVWVGQRLKIPASGTTVSTAAASTTASAPGTTAAVKKPIRHTVKRGDTLSAIAANYGVSMSEIRRINKLKSDNVPLGQTLTITQ